ncbi:arsenite efflux MFS transporter ArsK [Rhizobium sp. L1K21]|uniref:arsenite efflux MFS transporter ArsK n=1 Tax=Rhizobium sp. L1K21 TaxID=2954933 RepID=UPI002091F2ED|nr:arsenite efflux MFS transporter ArsK [Rhizobium sp. L1K21]MCO6184786.1 arsenite efflux MFS transporter ArsK [Rhizobium sp. L1K21]
MSQPAACFLFRFVSFCVSRPAQPVAAVIILALGLSQIIGYGTLYYSFSILAPGMARDFSLSNEQIFGFFSAALLVGGLTAPSIGRWMDRLGAAKVMVFGSLFAALTLCLCALSPSMIVFAVGIVLAQIASGMVQYQAAFAALVESEPLTAPRSITYLTLIAGFASTLFWPITTALANRFDWQTVYFIFAALNFVICLPLHVWLASRGNSHRVLSANVHRQPVEGVLTDELRKRGILIVSLAFGLQGFALSSLLTHMVPMLEGLGLGVMAVTIAALFGPSQVASRLINMIFGSDFPPLALAMLSATLTAAGGFMLGLSGGALVGSVIFVLSLGLGSGIGSIAQGSVPLHLFGSQGYGAVTGRITAARLAFGSAAPFVFSFLMETIGIQNALMVNAALGALGILCFLFVASGGARAG